MKTLAAIDVGSNAIRLVLAQAKDQRLEVLERIRLPIRLGEDVFSTGKISKKTTERLVNAFRVFKDFMEQEKVDYYRAVATSALRDSDSSKEIIGLIKKEARIDLELIKGKEEGELVFQTIEQQFSPRSSHQIIIDLGGGSMEFIFSKEGKYITSKSFQLGTVRLMQALDGGTGYDLLEEEAEKIKKFLTPLFEGVKEMDIVGTGGNFRRLGKMRKKMFSKSSSLKIRDEEFERLLKILSNQSLEDMMQAFDMRRDRAEVIYPACLIIEKIWGHLPGEKIYLPQVGLADGILHQLGLKYG